MIGEVRYTWWYNCEIKNTPGIDLLVSDGTSAKIVQLKRPIKRKSIGFVPRQRTEKNLVLYLSISIQKGGRIDSDFHIVPSAEVIKVIAGIDAEYHKKHLEKYGEILDCSETSVSEQSI
jgi:hypothetical protein